MDLARPFQVVTPTGDGDVLSVLAAADEEFTGAEVSRLAARLSEAGVRKILKRLDAQGIVTSRRSGRGRLYRLNRGHLAYEAVSQLARLRERFVERLRETISDWREPSAYAALFGSAARADMDLDSDIDIFVVRPDATDPSGPWDDQIVGVTNAVTVWTGNDTRVLEYSEDEVTRAVNIDDGVLRSIAKDGIQLAGPTGYLQLTRRRIA